MTSERAAPHLGAPDPNATSRRPRPRLRRRVLVVAGLLVVVLVAALVWWSTRPEVVPYDDAAATGSITLCDASGHRVTEGSVDDRPFAAYAVGSTPLSDRVPADAPAYATLYGYQPRAEVDPLEFSGSPIGGPVLFTQSARPATQVGADAWSLANFTEVFPAKDDGYVQLRLITSAEGVGAFTQAYDTADVRIDGNRWHLVRGGHASCAGVADLVAR